MKSVSKKYVSLGGKKQREKNFTTTSFLSLCLVSPVLFFFFLIWKYPVKSGDTRSYQQKVVSKAKTIDELSRYEHLKTAGWGRR